MGYGPVNTPGMNTWTLPWNDTDVGHTLSDQENAIATLANLIRQNKWDVDAAVAAVQTQDAAFHEDADLRLRELAFAAGMTAIHAAQLDRILMEERYTVTLENTLEFPFNSTVNSPKSIALAKVRDNAEYSVEAEVLEHNGPVGEIEVTGKARNGFKVSYSGSGSSVTLRLRVKGGMS